MARTEQRSGQCPPRATQCRRSSDDRLKDTVDVIVNCKDTSEQRNPHLAQSSEDSERLMSALVCQLTSRRGQETCCRRSEAWGVVTLFSSTEPSCQWREGRLFRQGRPAWRSAKGPARGGAHQDTAIGAPYWFFGCTCRGEPNCCPIQSTYLIGRPLTMPMRSWRPPYTNPATRAALVVRAVMGSEKRSGVQPRMSATAQ